MNKLNCGSCGEIVETTAVYPPRSRCGALWSIPNLMTGSLDGHGATPLWQDPEEADLVWKREDLNLTGSFKDRGAGSLAGIARAAGATTLVMDSSGSAALAAAAAAAPLDLPLTIHVPETLSRERQSILKFYGCEVVAKGNREAAGERALVAAQEHFYFSHVYHPAFIQGTAASGLEVLEQGGETIPRIWMVPVGNGSLFLGLAAALRARRFAEVTLIAVQAVTCPGLRAPGGTGTSHASGIAIASPPRGQEILKALEEFHGRVVEVNEEEIQSATEALGHRGVVADPASGAVLAGVRRFRGEGGSGSILAWLTGSGLRGAASL